MLPGYSSPIRLDRNQHGGGLLVYVREDIPCRTILKSSFKEFLFIEINLRKQKWLLCCTYIPNFSLVKENLDELQKVLDRISSNYENYLLIGDFNAQPSDQVIVDFCQVYNLENIIKDFTCFKNPSNPSCIDLILTNKPKYFLNTYSIETGLSDFHKMTLAVLKTSFVKKNANIRYRNYKKYSESLFRIDILNKTPLNDTKTFTNFQDIVTSTFNNHVPIKKRHIRDNQVPFITKKLSKEIMKRSRRRNKYNKFNTESNKKAYKKQRNYCLSLLRKEKKMLF